MRLEVNCDKYTFDERAHKHYINGREVTGTTTIVGVIDKPALVKWAVKVSFEVMLKLLKKRFKEILTLNKKQFEALVLETIDEAKKEPENRKKEAGRFGTIVHAICEHFNLTGEVLSPYDERLPEDIPPLVATFTAKQLDKAVALVGEYVEWFRENKVEVVAAEQNVFSETYFVGGIFDMILRIDGKLYIADFKTSSGVYPSQFVQMGGYQLQLEEMAERGYIDGLDTQGYIVIHLPRKGKMTVHRKEEVDIYRRAFRACVYIYRVVNEQLWAL